MDIAPHGRRPFPRQHKAGKPRTRSKRAARMMPQTAGCLLAATMLVTVPAEASARPAPVPEPRPASAQRLAFDPATLRKVRAYNKYRRAVARQQNRARTALRFARKQVGKPYGWGATGPRAYDCSGLVMKSWRRAGVRLPRVTYSQYRAVPRKVPIRSLRPGDLVFFRGRAHVGMYVSDNRYIHAPNRRARIRIDRLSGVRRKQFSGAVRPGAPEHREWPAPIPQLARRLAKEQRNASRPDPESPEDSSPGTPVNALPVTPSKYETATFTAPLVGSLGSGPDDKPED
ncbi:hypothetical protein GCM10010191_54550 [Actinomadura vinacea]|uniref:NlpC/P60 domain-containing protein n=1 Tax=Actinomadura vinacea TaxID=115336 RepID=A0ABP5WQD7_9ACTN